MQIEFFAGSVGLFYGINSHDLSRDFSCVSGSIN